MGAWIRAEIAAFWMMPRALSATPFSSRLFALVNSCLIQYCLHTSPKSPPKNSLPLSDLTISTFDGTSARTSAKNFLNASAKHRTYARDTHEYRVKTTLTIITYILPSNE